MRTTQVIWPMPFSVYPCGSMKGLRLVLVFAAHLCMLSSCHVTHINLAHSLYILPFLHYS